MMFLAKIFDTCCTCTNKFGVDIFWIPPFIKYIVQFEETLIPPHRKSMEFTKGRGVASAAVLKEKYGAKLEFPRGGGGGGLDILWNHTLLFTGKESCVLMRCNFFVFC